MHEEAGYFAAVIIIFLLFVLTVTLILHRGLRKDSAEYDKRFLWDLYKERNENS